MKILWRGFPFEVEDNYILLKPRESFVKLWPRYHETTRPIPPTLTRLRQVVEDMYYELGAPRSVLPKIR